MSTRAKFVVQERRELKDGFQVILNAVTGDSEENKSFFKYTPSGRLDMGLVQADTADQFVPGKEFYLDFTEVKASKDK